MVLRSDAAICWIGVLAGTDQAHPLAARYLDSVYADSDTGKPVLDRTRWVASYSVKYGGEYLVYVRLDERAIQARCRAASVRCGAMARWRVPLCFRARRSL